ncbi:MAG: ABC transporter ATP-binding protein [Magnetococcales bacterium]|nr:ABC transporter ATP-binding protein [Magnetococcales bacterium]MBF0321362.1 ABC transporter ATP-binding protein [Magnetococcales bacterium]
MTPFHLEVRNLHHLYPDGTKALDGVSFGVGQGESVAVVGGNGAGKSTLLLLLGGVIQPAEGSLLLRGEVMARLDQGQMRRAVGLVFQHPDDQLFMPTVEEDVAFGPLNLGMTVTQCRQVVQNALTAVDAWHLRQRPSHRLSSGEKRRVALATILAMEPDILLLDEPYSGLDPQGRHHLAALLRSLPQTRIVVGHDLAWLQTFCGRTIHLAEGRIVADDATGRTQPWTCPACGK